MDLLDTSSQIATVATALCVGVSWAWGKFKKRQGLLEGIPQGLAIGEAKGLEQGLEQGLRQGREKGIEEGSAKIALEVLEEFKNQGVVGVEEFGELSPEGAVKAAIQSATKSWATKLTRGQTFHRGEVYHITDLDKILLFNPNRLNMPGSTELHLLIDGKSVTLHRGVPTKAPSLPGHSLLFLSYDNVNYFDPPGAKIIIRKDNESWLSASERSDT